MGYRLDCRDHSRCELCVDLLLKLLLDVSVGCEDVEHPRQRACRGVTARNDEIEHNVSRPLSCHGATGDVTVG